MSTQIPEETLKQWREVENHGLTHTKAYGSWRAMRSRCNCKSQTHYSKYGGRGIVHCEKWSKFSGFFEDMGERPEGMELERIDNDGPYSKENCKWAHKSENLFNKRTHGKYMKGVYLNKKKFTAKMQIGRQVYQLGTYEKELEAHEAYNKMCMEWYGRLSPTKQAEELKGEK